MKLRRKCKIRLSFYILDKAVLPQFCGFFTSWHFYAPKKKDRLIFPPKHKFTWYIGWQCTSEGKGLTYSSLRKKEVETDLRGRVYLITTMDEWVIKESLFSWLRLMHNGNNVAKLKKNNFFREIVNNCAYVIIQSDFEVQTQYTVVPISVTLESDCTQV
jgi:hypothetical protein